MKKKYLIFLLVITALCVGLLLKLIFFPHSTSTESLGKNPHSYSESQKSSTSGGSSDDICAAFEDINRLLENSSKASGNALVQFLGLSEVTKDIATQASAAISKSDEIISLIKSSKTNEKFSEYKSNIQAWKDKFTDKSDIIKKAKQQRDMDKLSPSLEDMLKLIKDYNEYLDQMLKQLK